MKHATRGSSETSAASLRSLLEDGAAGSLADGELLGRFVARGGERRAARPFRFGIDRVLGPGNDASLGEGGRRDAKGHGWPTRRPPRGLEPTRS